MDFWQWLIPLVGFVVWIISAMAKNQQEEARREEQRRARSRTPRRDADREESRPRRTPEEIDKFLEEVRRRKRAKEEGAKPRPQPIEERRSPPRAEPRPESRPQPQPRPQPQSRPQPQPRSQPRTAPPPVPRSEPVDLPPPRTHPRHTPHTAPIVEVRLPVGGDMTKAAADLQAIPIAETVDIDLTAPKNFYEQEQKGDESPPAVRTLKTLLSNPQNLAAAFMLSEIFNKPLSKRPRRR